MVLIAVIIIFALLGYYLVVQNGFFGFKDSEHKPTRALPVSQQENVSQIPKDAAGIKLPELVAVRRTASDTTTNTNTICEIIDANQARIVFFGTGSKFEGDNSVDERAYTETNLPLMAALVELDVPHFGKQYIVLDGTFLTARRHPRYMEIREVLDRAEVSENCYFSKAPAPFTASKTASEAASILLNLGDVRRLNKDSRNLYFSLLSPYMSEKQHQDT